MSLFISAVNTARELQWRDNVTMWCLKGQIDFNSFLVVAIQLMKNLQTFKAYDNVRLHYNTINNIKPVIQV